jgi:hypothetical protein
MRRLAVLVSLPVQASAAWSASETARPSVDTSFGRSFPSPVSFSMRAARMSRRQRTASSEPGLTSSQAFGGSVDVVVDRGVAVEEVVEVVGVPGSDVDVLVDVGAGSEVGCAATRAGAAAERSTIEIHDSHRRTAATPRLP